MKIKCYCSLIYRYILWYNKKQITSHKSSVITLAAFGRHQSTYDNMASPRTSLLRHSSNRKILKESLEIITIAKLSTYTVPGSHERWIDFKSNCYLVTRYTNDLITILQHCRGRYCRWRFTRPEGRHRSWNLCDWTWFLVSFFSVKKIVWRKQHLKVQKRSILTMIPCNFTTDSWI